VASSLLLWYLCLTKVVEAVQKYCSATRTNKNKQDPFLCDQILLFAGNAPFVPTPRSQTFINVLGSYLGTVFPFISGMLSEKRVSPSLTRGANITHRPFVSGFLELPLLCFSHVSLQLRHLLLPSSRVSPAEGEMTQEREAGGGGEEQGEATLRRRGWYGYCLGKEAKVFFFSHQAVEL
jgi:hypothetical protein